MQIWLANHGRSPRGLYRQIPANEGQIPSPLPMCRARRMMTTRTVDGSPKTERSLRKDLVSLGAKGEMTLMVHLLSELDWMGARRSLDSSACSPGCAWGERHFGDVFRDATLLRSRELDQPQLPEAWLEEVREHLPVFDRQTTPTSRGAIPEAFRTWPGTLRSNHPLESVCVRGALASEITRAHPLAFSQGREGPYGKLYELDSRICYSV